MESGLNPAGAAKLLPSNEVKERKPAICRPIHDGDNYDTLHYKLRWPAMATLQFPPALIEAMEEFLSKHPYDNVPLNIALAATIIYIDLEGNDGSSEAFLAHCSAVSKSPKPPKLPPLGQFVLYFPHMLRYAETKRLTAFIHPARFTTSNHRKDKIKVTSTHLNTQEVRELCAQIEPRFSQVPKTHRFNLIPASMPGTSMVFPQDCTNAERPSDDLFRLCCLNDIRTLGLPSYHPYESVDDDAFRTVGGPSWLFSKHLYPSVHRLRSVPETSYWRPKSNTKCMSLTSEAQKVGRSFPEISSDYYTDNKDIKTSIEQRFGSSAYYMEDCKCSNDNTENTRLKRSDQSRELYRVAGYLKIPSGELWQCPKTGCVEWKGKEAQLQDLQERGILERVMKGELEEPPAKRPRISERKLNASVKAKIEHLLASTAVLSRDWDAVRIYLDIDDPTVEGLQCSLSQARSFIADIKDAFRSANITERTGNLDDALKLFLRVVGIESQVALTESPRDGASQRQIFTQFGQSIEEAIEGIWELRSSNLKNSFKHALPYLKTLAKSPMVQEQVKVLKEIDDLLKGELQKD